MTDVGKPSVVVLFSIGLAACVPSSGRDSLGRHEQPIVAGVSDPELLGRLVPEVQQNGLVEQILYVGASSVTTCTGTLIGDRVVLTAGHCVMKNMRAWWIDGDPVIVAEPEDLSVRVGADTEDPACELAVTEVHLHPDIDRRFEDAIIERDLALLVLEPSTREVCPDALAIPLVRPEDDPPALDETLLIGGYGTTDPEAPPVVSWERFWAVAAVTDLDPARLGLADIGSGFAAPGDSGAPVLRTAADGSLRVVGVMSTAYSGTGTATRPESESAFLDGLLDRELSCGTITDAGACIGDLAVRCAEDRLSVQDCAAASQVCVEGEPTRCACGCDTDARCAADCACDADCPCACDATTGCEPDCSCDPDCTEPSCECDATAACDADCECDPTCATTECDCDVTESCEPSCTCDLDCAAPACGCDASSECDDDCDCDPDCRSADRGCATAPPTRRGDGAWCVGLVAVALSAARRAKRRTAHR